ncbi:hypothetical protein L3Y34_003749 [Caenorhabditis briggsae]|uniref:Uncharacterized protein n=1 Tax=Caenorhabditis briggsae TaxID=6238 RepID=A0AAE9D4K4_CAEBR|nr:hypothetical protein L3Y34_003749 [Caenorhabditis briggsae]
MSPEDWEELISTRNESQAKNDQYFDSEKIEFQVKSDVSVTADEQIGWKNLMKLFQETSKICRIGCPFDKHSLERHTIQSHFGIYHPEKCYKCLGKVRDDACVCNGPNTNQTGQMRQNRPNANQQFDQ